MWLKDEYTKGDDETLNYMFLHLSKHYQTRIKGSIKSNDSKARFINISILMGAFSPLLLILSYFFLSYFLL